MRKKKQETSHSPFVTNLLLAANTWVKKAIQEYV